ncbi:HK97 family phage prohead protease [Halomonas dongshanensis]|uniref:HK97 family phage prohead protease n=1 Tax=Halomonas dongshanensis TaxID=2890835 RepID=A0ABT2ECS0_9GAMM|nr:HK97 family phage prohead protease [Halomonas dongshanensis]MCS2609377.1 HK97 family phage prohead protease [Halomonas dongshanensis]
MERRALANAVETKGRTLYGYAARFDAPTQLDGFSERIRPGAFTRTLASKDAPNVRAIYEHDGRALLGRAGSGSLRLHEDDQGLAFELDLPDTQLGRDVATLVKRGDVHGCSFGFIAQGESWEGETRVLEDVDLLEVTITATPAYDTTSVQVRGKQPRGIRLARLYLEACR